MSDDICIVCGSSVLYDPKGYTQLRGAMHHGERPVIARFILCLGDYIRIQANPRILLEVLYTRRKVKDGYS